MVCGMVWCTAQTAYTVGSLPQVSASLMTSVQNYVGGYKDHSSTG